MTNKYPENKNIKHKGDSSIIYEAGQRDPEDPFSEESFKRLIVETEGEEVDAKKWSEITYWTAFIFKGFENDPSPCHCTHKYLGEQTPENLSKIIGFIEYFFKNNNKAIFPFTIKFNIEEFFGENNDVRVLTPSDTPEYIITNFGDLRWFLNRFGEDDFPAYNPHVTTDRSEINLPIVGYALCQGDNVIKIWN